ncbi:MAG: hypothetical protein ACXAEN_16850, partial [Candidatus Thorarchaeota archaeon]
MRGKWGCERGSDATFVPQPARYSYTPGPSIEDFVPRPLPGDGGYWTAFRLISSLNVEVPPTESSVSLMRIWSVPDRPLEAVDPRSAERFRKLNEVFSHAVQTSATNEAGSLRGTPFARLNFYAIAAHQRLVEALLQKVNGLEDFLNANQLVQRMGVVREGRLDPRNLPRGTKPPTLSRRLQTRDVHLFDLIEIMSVYAEIWKLRDTLLPVMFKRFYNNVLGRNVRSASGTPNVQTVAVSDIRSALSGLKVDSVSSSLIRGDINRKWKLVFDGQSADTNVSSCTFSKRVDPSTGSREAFPAGDFLAASLFNSLSKSGSDEAPGATFGEMWSSLNGISTLTPKTPERSALALRNRPQWAIPDPAWGLYRNLQMSVTPALAG